MGITTIELPVDEETARAYRAISNEEKERIISMLSGWVKQSANGDGRTLTELAREIGEEAQQNGMTEGILAEILRA